MKAIENFLKVDKGHVEMLFTKRDFTFPSVDSNDYCIFYDKTKKNCRIHQVKPETCRAGPITFDINRQTKKVEWFLKESRLCALAGRLFFNPQKFNDHFKIAKHEIMQLIRQLDSESLIAILRREESQTFKIGEDPLPNEVLSKLRIE